METNQPKLKPYKTSDLFFSAFLQSIDIPLQRTEKEIDERGDKIIFVFDVSDAVLMRSKALYFGGTGTVIARKFVDNMRSLKSLIHT